jgi:hypothetical protein
VHGHSNVRTLYVLEVYGRELGHTMQLARMYHLPYSVVAVVVVQPASPVQANALLEPRLGTSILGQSVAGDWAPLADLQPLLNGFALERVALWHTTRYVINLTWR